MKTNGYEHWRRNLCKKRQGTPAPQRLYFLTRANKTNSTAKFGKSYSFSKETAKSTGTEYLENSRFLESKRLGTPAPQGLEIYAPQKKRAGILARQGLETCYLLKGAARSENDSLGLSVPRTHTHAPFSFRFAIRSAHQFEGTATCT
jgi:hypothetical protein